MNKKLIILLIFTFALSLNVHMKLNKISNIAASPSEPPFSLPLVNVKTIPDFDPEKLVIAPEICPFKPLLFEAMSFKGTIKENGLYSALFQNTVSGELIKLKFGEDYDGLTLLSSDNHSCSVQYGSVERRFEL